MICGCSSQVAMLDVSAAILDNSFKTSTPFTDTAVNETLRYTTSKKWNSRPNNTTQYNACSNILLTQRNGVPIALQCRKNGARIHNAPKKNVLI